MAQLRLQIGSSALELKVLALSLFLGNRQMCYD